MSKVQKVPKSPTTISSTYLQQNYGSIIRRATIDREHFIVERDGFPTVAVISAADYEALKKARRREK